MTGPGRLSDQSMPKYNPLTS